MKDMIKIGCTNTNRGKHIVCFKDYTNQNSGLLCKVLIHFGAFIFEHVSEINGGHLQ